MKNAVVWWELEISTGLPFSTLKGLAYGPRPPALQYVDIFYLVLPRPSICPSHPLKALATARDVAFAGNPGAEFED